MFFFLLGLLLSVAIYYKLIRPCNYWKQRGIPHLPAWPLVGSIGKVMLKKMHYMEVAIGLYNKYPDERYAGYMMFTRQMLLLRDPELIKQITIKDAAHFQDHNSLSQPENDIMLSKSLLFLNGQKWKDMRSTLSPVFTSSKMKTMYSLIADCAENFVNHFGEERALEMREIFSKYANDVIASTAFGIRVDSMREPDNDFFVMGTSLTQYTTFQALKSAVTQMSKTLGDFFQIQVTPAHVTDFFRKVIKENIARRESEGIVRPDMIQLLMDARRGVLKEDEEEEAPPNSRKVDLTDDHIVAQAMLFYFAGFDTVSTALSFMAYELAINPEVQKKLQEEIDSVYEKYQSKVPYEALQSMKYLDQVFSETLRLWPPAFETDRMCVKEYVIEPRTPEQKALLVEKGVGVVVPVMALHLDPQYYPEPKRFDPERFSDENKKHILPGTYLPFGIGPRNCIGSRFATLEIKTVFYYLLSKFNIVPIAKTQVPIKITAKSFNLTPHKGIWLGFKPRKITSL